MKNSVFIFFLAFVISGCLVTTQEARDRRSVTPEQEKRANLESKYLEVEEQSRHFNGRIETLENQIQRLQSEKAALATEKSLDKRALDEKLKIYEEAITKLESQNLLLAQKIEAMQAALLEQRGGGVKGAAPIGAGGKSAIQEADDDFKNKKWTDAILNYAKYRESNPTGKRYAEATYKIGLAFIELGNRADAKAFLTEVTQKFPKTEWAKKASDKLKVIK